MHNPKPDFDTRNLPNSGLYGFFDLTESIADILAALGKSEPVGAAVELIAEEALGYSLTLPELDTLVTEGSARGQLEIQLRTALTGLFANLRVDSSSQIGQPHIQSVHDGVSIRDVFYRMKHLVRKGASLEGFLAHFVTTECIQNRSMSITDVEDFCMSDEGFGIILEGVLEAARHAAKNVYRKELKRQNGDADDAQRRFVSESLSGNQHSADMNINVARTLLRVGLPSSRIRILLAGQRDVAADDINVEQVVRGAQIEEKAHLLSEAEEDFSQWCREAATTTSISEIARTVAEDAFDGGSIKVVDLQWIFFSPRVRSILEARIHETIDDLFNDARSRESNDSPEYVNQGDPEQERLLARLLDEFDIYIRNGVTVSHYIKGIIRFAIQGKVALNWVRGAIQDHEARFIDNLLIAAITQADKSYNEKLSADSRLRSADAPTPYDSGEDIVVEREADFDPATRAAVARIVDAQIFRPVTDAEIDAFYEAHFAGRERKESEPQFEVGNKVWMKRRRGGFVIAKITHILPNGGVTLSTGRDPQYVDERKPDFVTASLDQLKVWQEEAVRMGKQDLCPKPKKDVVTRRIPSQPSYSQIQDDL